MSTVLAFLKRQIAPRLLGVAIPFAGFYAGAVVAEPYTDNGIVFGIAIFTGGIIAAILGAMVVSLWERNTVPGHQT